MRGDLIPFGKYKGQPAETLLADTDYRDWLLGQPWFRERFVTLYQTVINYGGEAQESPEHNEMQAAFLDRELCARLGRALFPEYSLGSFKTYDICFERGWDVVVYYVDSLRVFVECKPDLGDDFPAVLRQVISYGPARERTERACVVVRRAAFERVTWGQVTAMFATSHVTLIRESELDTDPA